MPQFTITAVSDQTRPWGDGMVAYRVDLKRADGQEFKAVEWSRKSSTPVPNVGQQVEGELEDRGQYGLKFKQARQGGGGGGGRGKDPQERAEIRRQNAQAQALRYMEIKARLGLIQDFKPSELTPLIDFFYADTGSAKP